MLSLSLSLEHVLPFLKEKTNNMKEELNASRGPRVSLRTPLVPDVNPIAHFEKRRLEQREKKKKVNKLKCVNKKNTARHLFFLSETNGNKKGKIKGVPAAMT